MKTISVTQLKCHFAEYLSQAANGERFIITRRSRAVAAILGIAELERLSNAARTTRHLAQTLGQSPSLLEQIAEGKVHSAMAAFGLWKDEEDLADLDKRVLENRHAISRPSLDY